MVAETASRCAWERQRLGRSGSSQPLGGRAGNRVEEDKAKREQSLRQT